MQSVCETACARWRLAHRARQRERSAQRVADVLLLRPERLSAHYRREPTTAAAAAASAPAAAAPAAPAVHAAAAGTAVTSTWKEGGDQC